MGNINQIKKYEINQIKFDNGNISIIEKSSLPLLAFKRIFFVTSNSKSNRGDHAHKDCSQFIFSLKGSIKLECDDGNEKKIFILIEQKFGVLVPPFIWTKQYYPINDSILGVMCDYEYDENDYIRDYSEFKNNL